MALTGSSKIIQRFHDNSLSIYTSKTSVITLKVGPLNNHVQSNYLIGGEFIDGSEKQNFSV